MRSPVRTLDLTRPTAILTFVIASAMSASPAGAQLDLAHPSLTQIVWSVNGIDVERSLAFTALSDYSMSFAGVFMDPTIVPSGTLRATLRAATPGAPYATRGATLAVGTFDFTNVGRGFYDVPLAYMLTGGQTYDIAFDIVAGNPGGWGMETMDMGVYLFDAPDPAYDVGGVVRVLDGGCFPEVVGSQCPGYAKKELPHVRLGSASVAGPSVVPEPGTYGLMVAGLIGVMVVSRRRRSP